MFRHGLLLLDLPAHELPAVLVILLVSAGVGGYLTARVAPGAATAVSARGGGGARRGRGALGGGPRPLARWGLGLGAFPRALLAVAILVPFGVLAGSARAARGQDRGLGLAGAAAVVLGALRLAGATAMALGRPVRAEPRLQRPRCSARASPYLLAAATVPPAACRGDRRGRRRASGVARRRRRQRTTAPDAAGVQPEALEAAPIA